MVRPFVIETGKYYFITFTVVKWFKVFNYQEFADIMVGSIKFCQLHKGLRVYSYCIMPNHVHMIASGGIDNLALIIRDMKKFTAKAVITYLNENPRDKMQDIYLSGFRKEAESNRKRYKDYCFWQGFSHPTELHSERFVYEKLNYIHNNPVKAKLVLKPNQYKLSSASNESPIKVLPIDFKML